MTVIFPSIISSPCLVLCGWRLHDLALPLLLVIPVLAGPPLPANVRLDVFELRLRIDILVDPVPLLTPECLLDFLGQPVAELRRVEGFDLSRLLH